MTMKMTKREVVKKALNFDNPPYVPWQINLTCEAHEKLAKHFSGQSVDSALENHFLMLGDAYGFFDDVGNNRVRDLFGVIWDRTEDKDIGVVEGQILPEPCLKGFKMPDPHHHKLFDNIEEQINAQGDRFRVFNLGFSLFERAWTLRGMEDLLMDFCLNPEFVHELLTKIADWNIEVMKKAVTYDIDCIHFGDDWGQQHGLIMGYPAWKKFLYPQLQRMYAVGKDAGKFVSIHSCGDVDELFPDLIDIGLNNFNPFQPEVMDVFSLMKEYCGKLCFYGGLSTQQTLPYGTPADVEAATRKLLDAAQCGGLVFAPAHAIESDVSLENMLTMMNVLKSQPAYQTGK
jgi:uroporphyrinogen decarboxylase